MLIKPENFTHIHIHSHHSIIDGSIPVSDIVDTQVNHGAQAVACTDHGSLTSAWFLYDHIHNVKGYDVKHIIGLEAYLSLTRDELNEHLANPTAIEDKDQRKLVRKKLGKKYHQILLAKNRTGYQNLIKIHNDGWENGYYYKPTTVPEVIFQHAEGIVATTTCLASIWCQHIMNGNIKAAEEEVYRWKEAFGDDFYVELQPTNNKTQKLVNIELIKLAKKTKTPMVVTNDVHYLKPEDHSFHYMLLNMTNLKKQADEEDSSSNVQKMWEFNVDDLYLKSLDQMKDSWRKHHQDNVFTASVFEEAVMGVSSIIDKIDHYTLEHDPLLPSISDKEPIAELRERVVKGLTEKVKKGVIPRNKVSEYQDRVIEELQVFSALDSENYILLCSEIANFCYDNNIGMGAGRGSAPSSLVLYLLGVTNLDPIKHKLIFARFLNKNRRSKLLM